MLLLRYSLIVNEDEEFPYADVSEDAEGHFVYHAAAMRALEEKDTKIAELEKALREAVSLLQRARDLDSDFNGYIDDEIHAFTKQHSSLMDSVNK